MDLKEKVKGIGQKVVRFGKTWVLPGVVSVGTFVAAGILLEKVVSPAYDRAFAPKPETQIDQPAAEQPAE